MWDVGNSVIGRQLKQRVVPEHIDENTVDRFDNSFTNIGPEFVAHIPNLPCSVNDPCVHDTFLPQAVADCDITAIKKTRCKQGNQT